MLPFAGVIIVPGTGIVPLAPLKVKVPVPPPLAIVAVTTGMLRMFDVSWLAALALTV
jgi:hypothetical protein